MFVAGFLMFILDSGGGGGGGRNDRYDEYDRYSDLVGSIGRPVRLAITDTFGDVLTPWAKLLRLDQDVIAMGAALVGVFLCLLVIGVLFWCARAFMKPGVIRLHSHILQTAETQSFSVMFSGKDRFVSMLLWDLLSGSIVFVTMVVALTPGGVLVGVGVATEGEAVVFAGIGVGLLLLLPAWFYVGIGLSLGAHAVTLENRSPLEALKRSWTLTRGNRWNIFLFFFVVALAQVGAAIVGVLLCCVGLIVTLPAMRAISDFAMTESFLLLTRGEDVSRYWRFWELRAGGL